LFNVNAFSEAGVFNYSAGFVAKCSFFYLDLSCSLGSSKMGKNDEGEYIIKDFSFDEIAETS